VPRSILPCLLVLACSLSATSAGRADFFGLVDQQQLIDNASNNSGGLGLASRKAQTFIPTLTGLDAVEFKIAGNGITHGSNDAFRVNIRDGSPSGTILGTSNVTTLPDPFNTMAVDFSFPSIVPLIPGHTYAMELVPVALATGVFTVRVATGNPYPNGTYFAEGTAISGTDAFFREGFQAAAVPEPSSFAFCALGAACFGYYLRKRRPVTSVSI